MAIPAAKAGLRQGALQRRDAFALDVERAIEAAERLRENALALPQLRGGDIGPVSGYWPIRGEIDPRPLMVALHDLGVPLALPVIVDGDLVFRVWKPWEPLVPAGGFGTLGPPAEAEVVNPRILLTPLAAFDRAGNRVGYGMGFYDRAISRLAALGPVTAIGIAYACQEVAAVPATGRDRRLDVVVTEGETIIPV